MRRSTRRLGFALLALLLATAADAQVPRTQYGTGQPAVSTVLRVVAPLTGSCMSTTNGPTCTFECPTASGGQAGCISTADYTTFANDDDVLDVLADLGDLCGPLESTRRNLGDTANECWPVPTPALTTTPTPTVTPTPTLTATPTGTTTPTVTPTPGDGLLTEQVRAALPNVTHQMTWIGGKLFVGTLDLNPAQLVRYNDPYGDLTDTDTITFTDDGKHVGITDMELHGDGFLYVAFRQQGRMCIGGTNHHGICNADSACPPSGTCAILQTTISKVNPTTLEFTDPFNNTTTIMGDGALETDGTYLYLGYYTGSIVEKRDPANSFNLEATSAAISSVHALELNGTDLWVGSVSTFSTIKRLSTADLSQQATHGLAQKVCVGGGNAGALCTVASECPGGTCLQASTITDDMAYADGGLFVALDDGYAGHVVRLPSAALDAEVLIPIHDDVNGSSFGAYRAGGYVWALAHSSSAQGNVSRVTRINTLAPYETTYYALSNELKGVNELVLIGNHAWAAMALSSFLVRMEIVDGIGLLESMDGLGLTESASGLGGYGQSGVGLLQGCADAQNVCWDETIDKWKCCGDDDVPEAGDFGALALTGDVSSSGLSTTLAAKFKIDDFTYTIPSLADASDYTSIRTNSARAITITQVCCEVDTGTTTTIKIQRDDGAQGAHSPADIISTLTCNEAINPEGSPDANGCTTSTIVGAEDNIAKGDRIDHLTVAAGTATKVSVMVRYTVD